MLVVWINGPFGVGKSTVAEALVERWPDALLFDPEQVGALLRAVLPPELSPDDFQDIPLWRALVREITMSLLDDYRRTIVVPMTLVVPAYFDEIVGELRREGVRVEHVALIARPETILQRVAGSDREGWAAEHVDRCLEALAAPAFAHQIETDDKPIEAVVDEIEGLIEVPGSDGQVRRLGSPER